MINIVMVKWIDASTDVGWQDANQAVAKEEEYVAYSVGLLVKEDGLFLYLAADFGFGENPHNRIITIPRTGVQSVNVIARYERAGDVELVAFTG